MRIVLQNKLSGLYFKDIEGWVRDSAEALDFVSSTSAIDFCVANKLNDMLLVFKFEDQQYDIVHPIHPDDIAAGRPTPPTP